MPPKKKKQSKPVGEGKKEVLLEIDKEFYEKKIEDLNQKLARLRSQCAELETENEEIKGNLNKLDEDRADIIAYLQRSLQSKADEIQELQERLVALQQTREAERATFLEQIKNMEHDFKVMHEQLISEIKLLNGKLNSLEEFRSQREELMNKFLVQEEAMEQQEKRHKITLYEVERKFIVGKDELKKDMESKLLQLSLDFQSTADIRIAATTQRVIRENVAINNELKTLMESWKLLKDDNEELKKKEKQMKIEVKLHNDEKIHVLKKNAVQTKIIQRLSTMYNKLIEAYTEFDHIKKIRECLENKIAAQVQELETAKAETQFLKQTLHARSVEENELKINFQNARREILDLKEIIQTSATAVKEAIGVHEETESDPSLSFSSRNALLSTLLEIFNKANEIKTCEAEDKISMETISLHNLNIMDSFAYCSGDLGLIPKSTTFLSVSEMPKLETSFISRMSKKKSGAISLQKASKASMPIERDKSVTLHKESTNNTEV